MHPTITHMLIDSRQQDVERRHRTGRIGRRQHHLPRRGEGRS